MEGGKQGYEYLNFKLDLGEEEGRGEGEGEREGCKEQEIDYFCVREVLTVSSCDLNIVWGVGASTSVQYVPP